MSIVAIKGVRIALVLLVVSMLFACTADKTSVRADSQTGDGVAAQDSGAKAIESGPAVDFTLPDTKGRNIKLNDFQGQVVWVTFWATWCHACKMEMTFLNDLKNRYADRGFEVLAINVDGAERRSVAMAQARALKTAYPVLFDPEMRVLNRYNSSQALPFAILIDRKGKLRMEQRGFLAGEQSQIEGQVAALLGE